jgi:hypothetical protein
MGSLRRENGGEGCTGAAQHIPPGLRRAGGVAGAGQISAVPGIEDGAVAAADGCRCYPFRQCPKAAHRVDKAGLRNLGSCSLTMACLPSRGMHPAFFVRAQGVPPLSIPADLTCQDGS